MTFEHLLAARTDRMGANAIREILKVVSRPGMISLASGIPAPECFPMDIMGRLTTAVIEKYAAGAFQYDPTGRTIPSERRADIARIIRKHNALLVEDDPYGALRYRGKPVPPIKTLAPDNVIYVGTLSKVFAPGLRIGFFVGPSLISKWLVLVKQGVDLHTSTFNQALASEYLAGGHMERQLPKILRTYKPKQEAMLKALEAYFPKTFRWSRPEGGMFICVEGPKGLDMETVYWKAVEENVAFVPGKFFYTQEGEGLETMRLNYTMTDEENIDKAIRILAGIIKSD